METYDVIDEILNIRSVTSSFKTNSIFNIDGLAHDIDLNIIIILYKKKKIQTSEPSFCHFSSIPCCSCCSLVVEPSALSDEPLLGSTKAFDQEFSWK